MHSELNDIPPSTERAPASHRASALDRFDLLERSISTERASVVAHSVYGSLSDAHALRTFMSAHVFAVWDFMSLLKSLQRHVTCVDVPWLAAKDSTAARLINEIVLGEESDEVTPGSYLSHFELYLTAMTEVGAETTQICTFVDALRAGRGVEDALLRAAAPVPARRFVMHTLAMCERGPVEVAAAFLLGREKLVPPMFHEILAELEQGGARCAAFRLYLERHVEVDAEEHGPFAQRLLLGLCGRDDESWRLAADAARESLVARRQLWDGVAGMISSARPAPQQFADSPNG